jgi:molecular chaperone GrpE
MSDESSTGAGADSRPPAAAPADQSPVKVVDRRWWARGETAGESGEAPSLKPTYVEQLERTIAEKDAELAATIAKYREASAQFDEARARIRREMAKDIERARRAILADLLDVVDNLDRAIEAAEQAATADPAGLLHGIKLVRDQFLAKMGALGIARMVAVGAPFDPQRHEAVSTIPTEDPATDGVVAGIVSHGYTIGDEVLRPAMVAVWKGPGPRM